MAIEQNNMHHAAILIDYILWQRIHSFPSSSSSSSSTPPISISQFGFVPLPSGQPDLQSRTGSWVWGSAEKTAHEGQVLSGLPHECHGPGAGKGSCGQKTWRKRTKFTPTPGVNIIYSSLSHLVIVSHPRAAFFQKRPSASKAIQLNWIFPKKGEL